MIVLHPEVQELVSPELWGRYYRFQDEIREETRPMRRTLRPAQQKAYSVATCD